MPILTKKQFSNNIHDSKINFKNQVYLIYGDNLLVDQLVAEIIKALLSKSKINLDIETFYDSHDDLIRLVNNIKTFSLFQNGKIVILRSSKVLKENEKTQNKGACKYSRTTDDNEIEYSGNKKLNIQNNSDSLIIKNLIDSGLPNKHYLLLLADTIDKRTPLFKIISNKGLVVDCSVSKNGIQHNQKHLIYEIINKLLSENKKTIDKEAYRFLHHNIVDIDAFSKIFTRLIDYVGEKEHITIEDAKEIFENNKTNPIFILTSAIVKQDLIKSLFYLNSLLLDNVHPLKILVSITNKIRKLILAKDFLLHDKNRTWKSEQTFISFKMNTLEAVKEYDKQTKNIFTQLDGIFELKVRNSKHIDSSIILLAGQNPYTAYITILEADKLKNISLFNTIKIIENADKKLRLRNTNPKIILESVIFSVCNYFKS